ncbi:MAG: amino acid adenylation domain-containing protein, partial [Cyanobacteria bacterium Co-bin13]|nr:amino acid adenylation domain-containing protein [Cyanobacteria bacterium Co-bin13]
PGAAPQLTGPAWRQGHREASQLQELPQPLLEALETLSQQAGATLFMTLLAAFQTLLHRYTGQEDIAIGSPIANRHRSELEGLIGFLVNSLVLRTSLMGDPPFRELLERVRGVTLAAYAHQDLPFEKLVEELQPARSLGQNPLFQVVFALQNTPIEQLVLPGVVLSPVALETKTARFDLELYVWKCSDNFRSLWGQGWQQSDGLRGVVVYNTDLFDAATIASLRHHFQTLLEGIVANPEAPLSALPLLTPIEHQELLQRWHGNPSSNSENACIHHLFEAQVRQSPGAIAVQFGDQQFTYEALNQGSNQLARYLQKAGVGPQTQVGICLERSVEAIAAMLAILKAGAAYVPLDPSYPPERLHFMLRDADITAVVTQTALADLHIDGTAVICLDRAWSAIAQEPDENLAIPGTADQLAYVIYTSGSTGTPKGVKVPHRAVNRLVCETDYVQIGECDRIAQVANLAFDAATFEVWGALLNGAQLIGIDRETTLSPSDFVAELEQQQISILFLTTALFNQTVSQIPAAFCSLKYLLFGGETVNVDRVQSVLQAGKPQHLLHVYGPTENTTFSTWYEVQTIPESAVTIPIGQAIANTQVYLLDARLNPVPPGVIGEIYLGGTGLAQGYLNRPELTAERFITNPFRAPSSQPQSSPLTAPLPRATGYTQISESSHGFEGTAPNPQSGGLRTAQSPPELGDLGGQKDGSEAHIDLCIDGSLPKGGRGDQALPEASHPISNSKFQNSKLYKTGDRALYRPDGNLEFLGRTDHQIKIRGFRVEPGEIETALTQHPTVQTAVVVVRELGGGDRSAAPDRQLVAYVVPSVGAAPVERDLRSHLKTKLPAYMVPAAFVMLETLPLTANGKVNQQALPSPDWVATWETRQIEAPTTSLETSLVELWTQLLGRPAGIHDNFFELGGHSLLATQMVSRIRDRLQVELPLRSVFETPTIAELAPEIEALGRAARAEASRSVQPWQSSAQRREEVEL